ncbi:adenosylcobinamide-phosphate synthase CbiB [Kordia sp.]|uniref:adenosylcobinamide-phosphate synthase CbiB n=1 Tax=Kordia sp. TaxID=1965332 RepID=UPI0025C35368|nr:adenosylcobinamide-phosphate synthase CbiB [Kordia sp.]MCH2194821.1 adenosylcobinamide-phosphate synthase CbiB [Kordia sp.]
MEPLIYILPLVIAYVLDLALGDPRWLPHPIRLYGNMIAFGEKILNKNTARFAKGAFLTMVLCSGVFLFFYGVNYVLKSYTIPFVVFNSIFLFYALANKSLIEEGKAVFTELKKGIVQGRKRLSWIVGRETEKLNAQQVKTAVFETLSENLSDGVIAPLFYYAFLGVPGAMLYKMVNTLDSMIGYKNERYEQFGKFAAKLDDVLNFIPARLTAILMLIITGKIHLIGKVFHEGTKHSSPNAGYPEAALAFILDCRFGGPNYYHGKLVDKPYIGDNDRIIENSEFKKVATINHTTTLLCVICILVLQYISVL